MSKHVVEAAKDLIDDPSIHVLTRDHPWILEAIQLKRDWWRDEVKTFAAIDSVKATNDILKLAFVEHGEAEAETESEVNKLVELGDVVVFLVAAVVRDVIAGVDPSGVVKMEESYLARYVEQEVKKIGNFKELFPKIMESVFSKVKNNFHPALNPPAPVSAKPEQINIVYATSYKASRNMRDLAKERNEFSSHTGISSTWRTVYQTNGQTEAKMLPVHGLAASMMKMVGNAFVQAYGREYLPELFKHWELTAPGMVGLIQQEMAA